MFGIGNMYATIKKVLIYYSDKFIYKFLDNMIYIIDIAEDVIELNKMMQMLFIAYSIHSISNEDINDIIYYEAWMGYNSNLSKLLNILSMRLFKNYTIERFNKIIKMSDSEIDNIDSFNERIEPLQCNNQMRPDLMIIDDDKIESYIFPHFDTNKPYEIMANDSRLNSMIINNNICTVYGIKLIEQNNTNNCGAYIAIAESFKIIIKLKESNNINGVIIQSGDSLQVVSKFILDYSNDGLEWIKIENPLYINNNEDKYIFNGAGMASMPNKYIYNYFNQISAKYIRIESKEIKSINSNNYSTTIRMGLLVEKN
jgi:hypothetical protein